MLTVCENTFYTKMEEYMAHMALMIWGLTMLTKQYIDRDYKLVDLYFCFLSDAKQNHGHFAKSCSLV